MSTAERLTTALAAEADAMVAEAVAPVQAQLGEASSANAALTAERTQMLARIAELEARPPVVAPPAAQGPSDGLWFRVPDGIHDSKRKAFAHYFGPYPRSFENAPTEAGDAYSTSLIAPNGQGGKWSQYGGWHSDRPLYRPPLPGDWRYTDCVWDIQTAKAAGIDGFFVDLLGLSGSNFDNYERLVKAASDVGGFYVVPMVDANGATGLASPADAGRYIASFAKRPSTFYLSDGRFVVSSFKLEGKSVQWWTDTFAAVKATAGVDVAFLSAALDPSQSGAYAAITYGESTWGYGGDPASVAGAKDYAGAARGRGKVWMAPIEGQQIRRAQGVFDEALGMQAQQASWTRAIAEKADYVQIVTWSDFSEGTTHAPSEARGYGPLDLDAWYIAQWKTGTVPVIVDDAVLIAHRSNLTSSKPSGPQTKTMNQWARGSRSPLADVVDVLVFATADAVLSVTVGGSTTQSPVSAGVTRVTVPLKVGEPPRAALTRGTQQVAGVASVVPVVAAPIRDDKQYYWFSSARGTMGQRAPYGP